MFLHYRKRQKKNKNKEQTKIHVTTEPTEQN